MESLGKPESSADRSKYLQVMAAGAAYPKKRMTNDDWAARVDTSDEWIRTRTGIVSRQVAEKGETTSSLAIRAARQAMARSGVASDQVGCCICASMTADSQVPNMACLVQRELGLPVGIPSLDLNAACSGFVYALAVAQGLLILTGAEYGLVIGAEVMTSTLDFDDRNTAILFGDGAGAVVVRRGCNDSSGFDVRKGFLRYPGLVLGSSGDTAITKKNRPGDYLQMDGHAVYRFAVETLPHCIREVLLQTGDRLENVEHIVCHQANARILSACVRRLGAEPAQFFQNLDHTGNTCAASIPLAICEMEEAGLLHPGEKILAVGFGGGLTWGGMMLTYEGHGR